MSILWLNVYKIKSVPQIDISILVYMKLASNGSILISRLLHAKARTANKITISQPLEEADSASPVLLHALGCPKNFAVFEEGQD